MQVQEGAHEITNIFTKQNYERGMKFCKEQISKITHLCFKGKKTANTSSEDKYV